MHHVTAFVFVSTNLVYGPGRGRPARGEDEPRPGHAYPATKAAAEEALREVHRARGLGLRVLGLAFVHGEGDPHVAELLPRARSRSPARRLHMVHHADVGQALLLALNTPGIDGRTYNVADDAPITAAELLRLHGQPETPDGAHHEPFDPWEGIVDTLRIRDELGFRPIYPTFYSARDAGAL